MGILSRYTRRGFWKLRANISRGDSTAKTKRSYKKSTLKADFHLGIFSKVFFNTHKCISKSWGVKVWCQAKTHKWESSLRDLEPFKESVLMIFVQYYRKWFEVK